MKVATHKQRPPLHPLERTLLTLLCVELIFLPWAFGTMHAWSQIVSAAIAAAAFAVSVVPRNYVNELTSRSGFRLVVWPRLVRFPLFWLGAALIVLLGIQSVNVAWEFQIDTKSWWLHRVPHIGWLPSSTRTPFERFNIWRAVLIYGAAWLCVCAVWIGITRRRSLQLLFGVLVGNALVLTGVGVVQRVMNEQRALWIRTFKDATSFSSFVYQNHGGAYFALVVALSLALAVWFFFEGRKRMARSTSAPVWLLLSVILVFAVILSTSRGAVITLAVFAIASLGALLIIRAATPVRSTTPAIVSILMTVAFAAVLAFTVRSVNFTSLTRKFQEMATLRSTAPSVSGRALARHAAWDMYRDYWLLGSGAGSYRYLYTPVYVRPYPEIYENGRAFWEHAHIDWLEIPTELGLCGVLLIASAFWWCLRRFFAERGWKHPIAMIVLLGCAQTLLHAAVDFPFQNPAVLITWWVMLIGSLRWLELETSEMSRAGWVSAPVGESASAELNRTRHV